MARTQAVSQPLNMSVFDNSLKDQICQFPTSNWMLTKIDFLKKRFKLKIC